MADIGNLSCSLVCELRGHTNDVNSCAWSPVSSQLLSSCGGDATFRVWDVSKAQQATPTTGGKPSPAPNPSPALVKTVKAHDYYINSIAFNPSGDVLATASSDNTVKLWSTATWTEIGMNRVCVCVHSCVNLYVYIVNVRASLCVMQTSERLLMFL